MEIQNASEILLIIVSSVLSIFLIVAIILGIYLIKLTAEIRSLAKTAKGAVDHIDSAANGISKLVSPMFVANLVGQYIKKFTKKGKK
jgi:cobalamin biosynthesis protein CobD/CbiB